MILLDLLYNIHFAPFRNYPERGRSVAVAWLSASLTFIFFGFLFVILYLLFDFRFFRTTPALFNGIVMLLCYVGFFYALNKIYIVNQRDPGLIRYPTLYTLLIPILGLVSLGFFIFTADNFG